MWTWTFRGSQIQAFPHVRSLPICHVLCVEQSRPFNAKVFPYSSPTIWISKCRAFDTIFIKKMGEPGTSVKTLVKATLSSLKDDPQMAGDWCCTRKCRNEWTQLLQKQNMKIIGHRRMRQYVHTYVSVCMVLGNLNAIIAIEELGV